jgi:hypothetical protein
MREVAFGKGMRAACAMRGENAKWCLQLKRASPQ